MTETMRETKTTPVCTDIPANQYEHWSYWVIDQLILTMRMTMLLTMKLTTIKIALISDACIKTNHRVVIMTTTKRTAKTKNIARIANAVPVTLYSKVTMNVGIVVLNCQKCNQCLKGHKSLRLVSEGVI